MFELLLLGLALSMDAFAISISLGATRSNQVIAASPLMIASYFGIFHGIMPFSGYLIGTNIFDWFESFSRWICFGILLLIGLKGIFEFLRKEDEINVADKSFVSHTAIFAITLAVSIDAFAAGFTLVLLPVSPMVACFIIGSITFTFSVVGEKIGQKGGLFLQSKAELFGGIILILIGFNILLSEAQHV